MEIKKNIYEYKEVSTKKVETPFSELQKGMITGAAVGTGLGLIKGITDSYHKSQLNDLIYEQTQGHLKTDIKDSINIVATPILSSLQGMLVGTIVGTVIGAIWGAINDTK